MIDFDCECVGSLKTDKPGARYKRAMFSPIGGKDKRSLQAFGMLLDLSLNEFFQQVEEATIFAPAKIPSRR